MIQAGTLRIRIKLLKPTGAEDIYGDPNLQRDSAWEEVDEVWAAVLKEKPEDLYAQDQTGTRVRKLFLIRHRDDIALSWAVEMDDKKYIIEGITEYGAPREGLVLTGSYPTQREGSLL